MAKKEDDLLLDELDSVFFDDKDNNGNAGAGTQTDNKPAVTAAAPTNATASTTEEDYDSVPGQLAVDVYETADKLVVKARTSGVNKNDLDVSIADGVLTVSGTLSSGDDAGVTQWHVQEIYWGEFSRTLVLPVPVKEDEVEAVLKDGVLTISFNKIKQESAKKIQVL